MTTPRIEEIEQEFEDMFIHGLSDVNVLRNWLRTTITTILNQAEEEKKREVEDIIKMADALELECGRDGDKGTKQWMAFKGFRNTIRDKYLTTTISSDKTNDHD